MIRLEAALLYSLGGWTALGGLIYYSRMEKASTGTGSGACGHRRGLGREGRDRGFTEAGRVVSFFVPDDSPPSEK
uniref:Uncharacterized protein n=1 Tax=Catharus ustulatus TaxID=91951 RepID=A0A8C3TW89_CATUS